MLPDRRPALRWREFFTTHSCASFCQTRGRESIFFRKPRTDSRAAAYSADRAALLDNNAAAYGYFRASFLGAQQFGIFRSFPQLRAQRVIPRIWGLFPTAGGSSIPGELAAG